MHRSRKPAYRQRYREFESLPVRISCRFTSRSTKADRMISELSATALKQDRPNATFAPYMGYNEKVANTTLVYWFPRQSLGDTSVNGDAQLETITAARLTGGEMKIGELQDKNVADLVRRLGKPLGCYRSDSTSVRADWNVGDARFEVQVHRQKDTDSARVVYLLTSKPIGAEVRSEEPFECSEMAK